MRAIVERNLINLKRARAILAFTQRVHAWMPMNVAMYKLGLAALLVVTEFLLARLTRLDMRPSDALWVFQQRRMPPCLHQLALCHPGIGATVAPTLVKNLVSYEELLCGFDRRSVPFNHTSSRI